MSPRSAPQRPPVGPADPAGALRGVGPARAALLARVGVASVRDLLALLPHRYEDRRRLVTVAELVPGASATFAARVVAAGPAVTAGRRRRVFRAVFADGTGRVEALWFRYRPAHLAALLAPGSRVLVTGSPAAGSPRRIVHPDVEPLAEGGARSGSGVRPVYPATEGLSQAVLRAIVRSAVDAVVPGLRDPLPVGLRARLRLASLPEALLAVHTPGAAARLDLLESPESPWRRRLLFEELLELQLRLARRRQALAGARPRRRAAPPATGGALPGALPFALTAAQRRVAGEIARDLAGARPMQRLLQGDVGSGKTVVAALAVRLACAAGGQAALMIPTELLAEQHYATFGRLAAALGVEAALLTGGTPAAQRRRIVAGLASGEVPFVVGTHALVGGGVRFARLTLAIVDEQHRFGVRQRLRLREKGEAPDLLVMTATPIPRSLALALYGDLDLSVIDELPPGRRPVATQILEAGERPRVLGEIAAEIAAGGRVFVVCPLAVAGDEEDPADAARVAEALRRARVAPAVGLVHGGQSSTQRSRGMERFRTGETPLLVATTVVEVGVDVPEASLMVVERAERFGLSQLHQLRGRVGRGERPGRCLLVCGADASGEARERLAVLARTADGFAVAEADLALRGPGELAGVRQAGETGLRFADLARDPALLAAAREEALRIVRGTGPGAAAEGAPDGPKTC